MSTAKERPILFSAPMVRAILAGTKTQTRRICKPAATLSAVVEVPDPMERGQVYNGSHFGDEDGDMQFACPYGGRGDRLWVREAFDFLPSGGPDEPNACEIVYWATGCHEARAAPSTYNPMIYGHEKIRPSIHMPRWASRITLEVTGVRVQRLQEISEVDCVAEGCAGGHGAIPAYAYAATPLEHYHWLWNSIIGPGSWEASPWVWVVEFKQVHQGAAI